MQIVFDANGLEQTIKGAILGTVFFDFWTMQFPTNGWTDFVVVLANWWLAAVAELHNSESGCSRFQFMDGPYWIDARRRGDIVVLECFEDRRGAGVVHTEEISLSELQATVLKFTRQVLSAAARSGMPSSDIEELRRRLAS